MDSENKNNFRNEEKYLINKEQAFQIQSRLQCICKQDQNSPYNVRSLYFEDINNSCFYSNREGLPKREKIRLRTYNFDDSKIFLELKEKEYSLSRKRRCLITKEDTNNLIRGNIHLKNTNNENHFLMYMYSKIKTGMYFPKIIVDYKRIAYTLPFFKIRITIDSQIKTSSKTNLFFERNYQMIPILTQDKCILEVKYSQILPKYFNKIINLEDLKKVNFSKYYNARKQSIWRIKNEYR
ncbi:polyphosphate polymerase domain-containing protein [bacterium]|nr:polyphosphate polymerase domain-containing protein [bacterium]